MEDVSRHVAPRPIAAHLPRSRLQLLPGYLYNSATESKIIQEMKEKVRFTTVILVTFYYLHACYAAVCASVCPHKISKTTYHKLM